MRKSTLLAIGSWALALFVLFLIWVPPQSPLFPGPPVVLWVSGLLSLFWAGGMLRSWFPRGEPGLSVRAQIGAVAPLLTASVGLILVARGTIGDPMWLALLAVAAGAALAWWCGRDPGQARALVSELAIVGLGAAVFFVIMPIFVFAFVGSVLMAITVPNFGPVVQRARAVEVLAPYRLGPQAGVSIESAGAALLEMADTTGRDRWQGGAFSGWRGDSVIARATVGLGPAERAWLRGLAADPAAAHLRTLARAPVIDPVAYIETPIPPEANAYTLPVPPVLPLRDAARRHLYRAALAHAEGRRDVADSLVREVITFGLRLKDDADLVIVSIIGTSVAREGGLALAALWRSSGRIEAADSLTAALSPALATGVAWVGDDQGLELMAKVRDPGTLRSLRWESLAVLGVSRCTSPREVLFGPSDELLALYEEVRPALVRTPKEGEVFEVFRRGFTAPAGDAGTPVGFGPAERMFGNRTMSACLQMLRAMN